MPRDPLAERVLNERLEAAGSIVPDVQVMDGGHGTVLVRMRADDIDRLAVERKPDPEWYPECDEDHVDSATLAELVEVTVDRAAEALDMLDAHVPHDPGGRYRITPDTAWQIVRLARRLDAR